jgi:hypothetical protein
MGLRHVMNNAANYAPGFNSPIASCVGFWKNGLSLCFFITARIFVRELALTCVGL